MLRSVLQNEDFKQDGCVGGGGGGGGDVIGVHKSSIFCPLHFYYLCSRAILFMGNMLEQRRMRCTTILMILERGGNPRFPLLLYGQLNKLTSVLSICIVGHEGI